MTFRALTLHQSLWRRANARNVSFTLYGGQFTLSTQLIILNWPTDCKTDGLIDWLTGWQIDKLNHLLTADLLMDGWIKERNDELKARWTDLICRFFSCKRILQRNFRKKKTNLVIFIITCSRRLVPLLHDFRKCDRDRIFLMNQGTLWSQNTLNNDNTHHILSY